MKIIALLALVVFFVVCASVTSNESVTERLSIHDIVFSDRPPLTYDGVKELEGNSFYYGEEPWLVIKFGGLEKDDENNIYWTVVIEVYFNDEFMRVLGPEYFQRDLDEGEFEEDKYVIIMPLPMYDSLPHGLYRLDVTISDAMSYGHVRDSIEFSLLPVI